MTKTGYFGFPKAILVTGLYYICSISHLWELIKLDISAQKVCFIEAANFLLFHFSRVLQFIVAAHESMNNI